jgi:P-type Cu+ transporter
MQKTTFSVSDINCAACVAKIEKALTTPGIDKTNVNIATKRVTITHDTDMLSVSDIRDKLAAIGYKSNLLENANSLADEKKTKEKDLSKLKTEVVMAMGLSVPLIILAMGPMLGFRFSEWVVTHMAILQFLLATPVLFIGRHFFIKGIGGLIRNKIATMDTLVALGVGSAYLYSMVVTFLGSPTEHHSGPHLYYETAAFLISFILLGRFLEAMAKGKTNTAIQSLIALQPNRATVLRDGIPEEIDTADVLSGDIILVKPGQRIPVDGTVLEGHSAVDESMITGESMPIEKDSGATLIGGTYNTSGSITYTATNVGENSLLFSIIRLIENAQSSKAPVQKIADQVAAIFVPIVGIIAVLSCLTWLFLGYGFPFALNSFITVMIIACPCALGLATPTAVIVATGLAAKKGILIKNAETLQKTGSIQTIVLDKTGTLTTGKPTVTDILTYHGSENDILTIAASLNQNSEHPLATAIVAAAKEKKLPLKKPLFFEAKVGKGVTGRLCRIDTAEGEVIYSIGNRPLMSEINLTTDLNTESNLSLEAKGKTLVFVAQDNTLLGIIAIADSLKKEAPEAIRRMQKMGLAIYMLTGDNQRTATAIATACGIQNVIAEVLPHEKDQTIITLKKNGHCVAMVGDGINDSPALVSADVGIAMGAGTDIAINAADIVLIKNNLQDIIEAIEISKYSMRKIKQNLFWAFAYNALGIPIAAGCLYPHFGFLLNPMIAGAAMAFSSVSVITNTLFMKSRFRPF